MTEWRPIEGYMYPYRVSDTGVVQKQEKYGQWRTLKQYRSPVWDGHTTRLRKRDGTQYITSTARLVVTAFIRPLALGEVAIHIDSDPENDRPENLMIGKKGMRSPESIGNGKEVTVYDADENIIGTYRTVKDSAAAEGVCVNAIRRSARQHAICAKTGHRYSYKVCWDTRGDMKR